MTIGELTEAQKLTESLSEYLSTERQLLEELKECLEQYQDFLMEQIRETRDIRTTTNEQSNINIRKIPVRAEE